MAGGEAAPGRRTALAEPATGRAEAPAAAGPATRTEAPREGLGRRGVGGEAAPEGLGRRGVGGEAAPRRRRVGRTRDAAGATAGAVGAGVIALARLVMLAAVLIAVLIVLAIVLRDVDANASNSVVKGIHEGANFFAGAFTGLITFAGHPKRAISVNWGIAAVVYLIVGALIARLIAGIGRSGVRFERRNRAIPTH